MFEIPSLVFPPPGTAAIVRWLHVVAMAVVTGGAVLTWTVLRTSAEGDHPVAVAVAYEWLFWAGMGVLVMTGIGNLGAAAPFLPLPGTQGGLLLGVKLPLVVLVLVGSIPRTLAVDRLSRMSAAPRTGRLEISYALTASGLVTVVAVAVVLAHG